MRQTWLAAVMCVVLSAAVAQAQRGNGFHEGGGPGNSMTGRPGNGGLNSLGCGNGFQCGPGYGVGYGYPGYGYGYGYGGYGAYWPGYWPNWTDWNDLNLDFPYWDYVNFPPTNDIRPQRYHSPAEDDSAYAAGDQQPPVFLIRNRQPPPPLEPPKVIEVSLPKGAAAAKPQPPALFVLRDGEKLESRHYVLSADWLRINLDRRPRIIPLSALDLNATIAANQKRGIAMVIPQDGSSLFLGF